MSKFITFVLFIGLLLGFGSVSVTAQDVPPSQLLYAWTTPTTTGQLGHYLILVQNSQPATGNYSIDWSFKLE
jgi:hypothetical protein